ncbi:MAG: hypothetical protein KGN76_10610, partial [Acidobacteriota bacterium]|nr:hypothetical protein [Acidobacteriota bacterium]
LCLRAERIDMVKRSTFGICQLCQARVGKVAMGSHLRKCLQSRADRQPAPALIVRAEAPGARMFWLDIASTLDAKLQGLDGLLRRIWLECCGHLSAFYGGERTKVSMSRRLGEVLGAPGDCLGYEYDFGSTTELVVSHVDLIDATVKGIRVVARNEAPMWACEACGQPATKLCTQCSDGEGGFMCEPHAAKHRCGAEMLLPVVYSPRMGVCGYVGEA